jgi:hypothetical protein
VINNGAHICTWPNGPFALEPKCSSMVDFRQVICNVIWLQGTSALDRGVV